MNKLFNNLRKKLITEGITTNPTFAKACATAKTLNNKRLSGTHIKYAIGEIVLVVVLNKTKSCPVRDKLWVATNNNELYPRAFRPACRFVAYSFKAQGGRGRPNGTIKIELQ